jgi:hypothetical protein
MLASYEAFFSSKFGVLKKSLSFSNQDDAGMASQMVHEITDRLSPPPATPETNWMYMSMGQFIDLFNVSNSLFNSKSCALICFFFLLFQFQFDFFVLPLNLFSFHHRSIASSHRANCAAKTKPAQHRV